MTKYICRKCDKIFDDKYYNGNEQGLRESLTYHAKFHKDEELVKETYKVT